MPSQPAYDSTSQTAGRFPCDCCPPSENPGLRRLAEEMAGVFPRLEVLFFENPLPYRWL